MMKIAIVDDEKEFLENVYSKILNQYDNIYSYISVFDMENTSHDFGLILLDIEMPDCDGIDYSKQHKDKNFIFVTSQNQRMQDAFGSNVYGFINKFDDQEKYEKIINNAITEIKNKQYITFKIERENHDFILNDIIYFQYIGYKNISFVYHKNVYILKGYTLKDIEPELIDQFVYIDRGTLINKDMITGLIGDKLYVRGIRQTFVVSARRKRIVKDLITLKDEVREK